MPKTSNPKIFDSMFLDKLFHELNAGAAASNTTRDELEEFLTLSVESAAQQLGIFWPTTNPVTTYCDMPYNGHSFRGTGKHCTKCGKDFCRGHAISSCVNCGTTL